MPLLEGTDGVRKMSKSFGNVIALEDRPADMYGKLMSISDDLMMRYYELLTVSNLNEVKQQHPMEAKKALAEQLVRQYHGDHGADEAKSDFQQRFQKRDFPDEPDAHVVLKVKDFVNPQNPFISIVDVLMRTGLVPSKGEARRLISQNAIQVNGEKMSDINGVLNFKSEKKIPVKIGKRKFALVEMVSE
jgi:tyrosyl-tRNA synthetase